MSYIVRVIISGLKQFRKAEVKALIDTNILIHRETKNPKIEEIGTLFYWLSKSGYQICIHPVTQAEIFSNKNKAAVEVFAIKMQTYELLRKPPNLHADVEILSQSEDKNENDRNDTSILNEIYCNRVDAFITEDKGIHKKARLLGIQSKVFTIENFLDLMKEQNPGFVDYDVLRIRKVHFIDVDISDPFFDSFKIDYPKFEDWFNKKSSEEAYVLFGETGSVEAFLYLKIEDRDENYWDIAPTFEPKKRLKIGTLKVKKTGVRLGERFLKIIFDNAIKNKVDEIYVTVFPRSKSQIQLIKMFEEWGFENFGKKNNKELVLVRKMKRVDNNPVNREQPKKTFPYISQGASYYIIPIKAEFHTDLFPDSILKGEESDDYLDLLPHRNAISKAYISNAPTKSLKSGDGIIFYRTGGSRPGFHNIITTVGIVEDVELNIDSVDSLIELTSKKTVFSEKHLRALYSKSQSWSNKYKLFIINFLYAGSLNKRYPLIKMIELGIVDSAPRSVAKISREQFALAIKNNLY